MTESQMTVSASQVPLPGAGRADRKRAPSPTRTPPSPKHSLISWHIRAHKLIKKAGSDWGPREVHKLLRLRINIRISLKQFGPRDQKKALRLLRKLNSIAQLLRNRKRVPSPDGNAIAKIQPRRIPRPVLDSRGTRSPSSNITWATSKGRRP
jgi:hypothetical protein